MKRISLVVLAVMLIVMTAAGCSAAGTAVSSSPISVATLAGPTGMGMIKMFGDKSYNVTLCQSPDEISPKIINGEVQVAAIPSNLAAVIYNKTKGAIKTVAVNTTGVLYILENGDTVNSLADLSGKTIYATGQGATPEYVLKKLLDANGVKDVNIEFMAAHADLANAMAGGTVKLALLPEPFVSTVLAKNKDVKVKIDVNADWQKVYGTDSSIPMGVVVVSSKFAENKTAMEKLISDYKASVDYAVSDSKAPADIAKEGIVGSEAIAKAALPRCGISFITGEGCKKMLGDYFNLMYESNPKSVGGNVPDSAFYYIP